MNFLNIEKNKFFSRFMLFPTSKKKIGVEIGVFLEKQFFLISFHVLCYFQHLKKIGNIEKFPWWFLQIVDRDSGNLCPIYPLFPCSDFLSQMWWWLGGWGGWVFFLHFVLFPTFLKKILGIILFLEKLFFSFSVFFVFF